MTVYSYSRLSAFQQCPLKYQLTYIDRLPKIKTGIEAFVGSRFHEVMEKLYTDIKFKIPTLEELLAFYEKCWDKEWDENVTIIQKDRTVEDYKNYGRKCIQDYYKRYYPFDQGKVLGIEKRIQLDLDDTGKYLVQGYIDRIDQIPDGSYEIHDYKTSGRMPGQDIAEEDTQLALYQIGVMNTWKDAENVKLIWHYVAFDKELVSSRTAAQLEELKKSTIEIIKQVESAVEYPPQESKLCDWCDYQEHCPLKKHLFKVSALPENEYLNEPGVKLVDTYSKIKAEQTELASQIRALDEELAKIKEATIKYGEKEEVEAIVGSHNQLNIKESAYISIPDDKEYEELEKIIKEAGKWDEVISINAAALNKALKTKQGEESLLEKVKKLVNYRTEKTVSMSKLKEEKEE